MILCDRENERGPDDGWISRTRGTPCDQAKTVGVEQYVVGIKTRLKMCPEICACCAFVPPRVGRSRLRLS